MTIIPKSRFYLSLILYMFVWCQRTLAQSDCPSEDLLVYSPFKPWFSFYQGSSQRCWSAAICLFQAADEARKQQFSATALIMGLLPLTLKDIAWPERRLVPVSHRLPVLAEILVRALSLEPVEVHGKNEAEKRTMTESWLTIHSPSLADWVWNLEQKRILFYVAGSTLSLLLTYAALVLVEVYSKRSSLGCIYPAFILTWYIVALLPATIHTLLSKLRHSKQKRKAKGILEANLNIVTADTPMTPHPNDVESAGAIVSVISEPSSYPRKTHSTPLGARDIKNQNITLADPRTLSQNGQNKSLTRSQIASAVQGAEEWWIVQLVWAIYYIAGTLVFTSIMAVTVIELFVWVMTGFAVTGASKLLALLLCMSFEVTGESRPRFIQQEGSTSQLKDTINKR
ncbi:hypothetical protein BT63DRAFT_261161 [Microthyrium microscopicum]|uniref:Uncharacterized protein n=1 Tax=Microthyrium microscopicum TaxID=703497 RepID=A0A6A6UEZ1_9PEZI|nr:hypothetical protein BT63DRAFT_261161 [Microthyrium microscopicum]